jgi:putative aldouronate transport system permease protein
MIYGIVGDNGLLFATTDIIDTYTFRALRKLGNFSMSSAVALYQSALGLILVLLSNWLVKRVDAEAGIF